MSVKTSRGPRRARGLALLVGAGLMLPAGCGEDEPQSKVQRGAPKLKSNANAKGKGKGKGNKAGSRRTKTASRRGAPVEDEPDVDPGPKRPPPTLDQNSFALRRDPFQGFVAGEPVQPEPDPIRAEREVQMRAYAFEDLRLVIIANTRRSGTRPRAVFVAGDGVSGTVRQGEYFSSAEVLLAAVNRDYVEIEVVDEELASSLGMERGDRRAVYLRNE